MFMPVWSPAIKVIRTSDLLKLHVHLQSTFTGTFNADGRAGTPQANWGQSLMYHHEIERSPYYRGVCFISEVINFSSKKYFIVSYTVFFLIFWCVVSYRWRFLLMGIMKNNLNFFECLRRHSSSFTLLLRNYCSQYYSQHMPILINYVKGIHPPTHHIFHRYPKNIWHLLCGNQMQKWFIIVHY